MKALGTAFAAGALFAAGLALAGMTDPGRVQAFLDLGGHWDGRLALVMGAAIPIYMAALAVARRQRRPLLAPSFPSPARAPVDRRLLGGAALFGVGWGLVGYCPGPGLVSLGTGHTSVIVFVLAMVAGMLLIHAFDRWRVRVGLRSTP